MEMFLLPLKTNIMIHAQILRDVTEEKPQNWLFRGTKREPKRKIT